MQQDGKANGSVRAKRRFQAQTSRKRKASGKWYQLPKHLISISASIPLSESHQSRSESG